MELLLNNQSFQEDRKMSVAIAFIIYWTDSIFVNISFNLKIVNSQLFFLSIVDRKKTCHYTVCLDIINHLSLVITCLR